MKKFVADEQSAILHEKSLISPTSHVYIKLKSVLNLNR
jgi:hypothetical protein